MMADFILSILLILSKNLPLPFSLFHLPYPAPMLLAPETRQQLEELHRRAGYLWRFL
jgi:hypothetical protein